MCVSKHKMKSNLSHGNIKEYYLRKVRNKLAVSKGLVVAHVGVKGSCIHQKSLRQVENHFNDVAQF